MIKPGGAIHLDKRTNRLYSRRSKNRIFFGFSHKDNNQDLKEGCRIHTGGLISDPKGFGIPPKDKVYDFKINLFG